MIQHTFSVLAHNCSRKDKRIMENYYEGERKGAGKEVGRKKQKGWKERGREAHSDFFGFSQVLCAFYFGPSLPLSMLCLQHAMPSSLFAPDEILLPSATGSNASKTTCLGLSSFKQNPCLSTLQSNVYTSVYFWSLSPLGLREVFSFCCSWTAGFITGEEQSHLPLCSPKTEHTVGLRLGCPKWHIDYFELKLLVKQPVQEGHADPPCLECRILISPVKGVLHAQVKRGWEGRESWDTLPLS